MVNFYNNSGKVKMDEVCVNIFPSSLLCYIITLNGVPHVFSGRK